MAPTVWNHVTGLLLYSLFFVPVSLLLYEVVRRILGEPHQRRQMFIFAGLTLLSWCTNRLIIMYANGLNVVASVLWNAISLWVVYGYKGWKLLLGTMKMMIMIVVMELICALILVMFDVTGVDASMSMVITLDDLFNPVKLLYTMVLNAVSLLPMLMMMLLWEYLKKRGQLPPELRRRQWLYVRSIIRLALLMIGVFSVFAMPHYLFGKDSLLLFTIPSKEKYILLILTVILMLLVAISYVVQDVQYIWQLQRLNTMEQQQAISRSLLQNLRYFRHNMVNMLYGLEGVLIGGDKEKVTAYYAEMREKCALVNNENIAALERITNPSVGAVLLHGVDKARQLNLPMNLYVQEKVLFGHVLSDADLCQVLGVLQDNAIEAANQAEERFVSIEIRNVENALEIIVKNTYSGEITPDQLTRGGQSTKEGHSGQGLLSCYHILGRRKGAFLNFWVTGQYVQAQLLLSR